VILRAATPVICQWRTNLDRWSRRRSDRVGNRLRDGCDEPTKRCYGSSLRRFLIHGREGFRASRNTIGVMVNPTTMSDADFAHACYRSLLACDRGVDFEADWLDEPRLWPKTITRQADLKQLRRMIPDLR
jgi:hypothetical protein